VIASITSSLIFLLILRFLSEPDCYLRGDIFLGTSYPEYSSLIFVPLYFYINGHFHLPHYTYQNILTEIKCSTKHGHNFILIVGNYIYIFLCHTATQELRLPPFRYIFSTQSEDCGFQFIGAGKCLLQYFTPHTPISTPVLVSYQTSHLRGL
jgi:hypothetical protein